MWIYLPAFGRVRRIASHARNGTFMGSDLTFEDMGDRKLDDYTYQKLGEEEIEGKACWIVEAIPNEGVATEYSKRVVWIWQEQHAPLKADLYDKRGNLLKQMGFTYEEVGGYLVPARLVMNNLRTGGHTELIFEEIEVDTGISPDLFKSNQLTRIRGG
jgi:negative regulator of sigma E activity